MKKQLFGLLLVVLLLAVSVIPALAGMPKEAGGLWQYIPAIESTRYANGNTFYETTEVGRWTGTFNGGSLEEGNVVILNSGGWLFHSIVIFDQVTVDDKTGSLQMRVDGSRPSANSDWVGKWVIIEGGGELQNLHGQGNWWGPGFSPGDEWGDIYYDGNYHFSPKN